MDGSRDLKLIDPRWKRLARQTIHRRHGRSATKHRLWSWVSEILLLIGRYRANFTSHFGGDRWNPWTIFDRHRALAVVPR